MAERGVEVKRTKDGPDSGVCSTCGAVGGACVAGWAVWVGGGAAVGVAGWVEGPATALRCLFLGARVG